MALATSALSTHATGIETVVYPTGARIPENLLRIELRFAKPLPTPLDMAHVQLLRADGHTIDNAFLDLPLASADGLKVTLLLHPGRVKSGVGANLALGRALQPGSSVTLRIDDPAIGQPVLKSWAVEKPNTLGPSPATWAVHTPPSGDRTPLVLELGAPVSSTAENLIAVQAPNGTRVVGVATLVESESVWRFVPKYAWKPGAYSVRVSAEVEDAEGNQSCVSFEMRRASLAKCEETLLPFVVHAAARE